MNPFVFWVDPAEQREFTAPLIQKGVCLVVNKLTAQKRPLKGNAVVTDGIAILPGQFHDLASWGDTPSVKHWNEDRGKTFDVDQALVREGCVRGVTEALLHSAAGVAVAFRTIPRCETAAMRQNKRLAVAGLTEAFA